MDKDTAKKIKSKNTGIERTLAKGLRLCGLRYEKHNPKIFGKPDFSFSAKKIAIFCDSEFWHGKKFSEGQEFKSNKDFWEGKIRGNIRRDSEVDAKLFEEGWIVLRFWGEDIEKNLDSCILKIHKALESRNSEKMGRNLLKKAEKF